MPFKSPEAKRKYMREYWKRERRLKSDRAKRKRASEVRRQKERYHTDPEFRKKAIRRAVELKRTRPGRRKAKAVETAARLLARAAEAARNGYSGKLRTGGF